jgi:hypothetical protein
MLANYGLPATLLQQPSAPLKERPDFIAGYREGLADRKRITEHEEVERLAAPNAKRLPDIPAGPTVRQNTDGSRWYLPQGGEVEA